MFRRILLAADLLGESRSAFRMAVRLARSFEAELVLCHVSRPPSVLAMAPRARQLRREVTAAELKAARRRLGALEKAARRGEVRASALVVTGSAANAVVRAARRAEADLLVVGSHGRTGIHRLLAGSVAEDILRQAPCPVLVVRLAPRR